MHDYLFTIVSSFAKIFLTSFVVWMIAVLVLMFKEMFSPGELELRTYLFKVGRVLLFSFEGVAYCFALLSLIMMLFTQKYVDYASSTVASLLLSVIYLSVRKKTVGFQWKRKEMSQEADK